MSLWFVSSATLADLRLEYLLSTSVSAALVSAVPAGFVLGALTVAMTGIADRYDPRRVFAVAALVAASANGLTLLINAGGHGSIVLRLITGFCLAGVYPVGWLGC